MKTGMYEVDMFDDDSKPDPTEWELVDGIKLGQSRTIYDASGEAVLIIGVAKTPAIEGAANLNLIYPLLVKRHEDGTVRQVLINFDNELEHQQGDEDGEPGAGE